MTRQADEIRAQADDEEVSPDTGQAGSKAFVILMVALIVGGVVAWNAWDYLGTEGLNPKKVKAMAKAYERECVEAVGDVRACRRHIGTRHRSCLSEGVIRAAPGEPPHPPRYDEEAYSACIRKHRDEDVAAAARQAPSP